MRDDRAQTVCAPFSDDVDAHFAWLGKVGLGCDTQSEITESIFGFVLHMDRLDDRHVILLHSEVDATVDLRAQADLT